MFKKEAKKVEENYEEEQKDFRNAIQSPFLKPKKTNYFDEIPQVTEF